MFLAASRSAKCTQAFIPWHKWTHLERILVCLSSQLQTLASSSLFFCSMNNFCKGEGNIHFKHPSLLFWREQMEIHLTPKIPTRISQRERERALFLPRQWKGPSDTISSMPTLSLCLTGLLPGKCVHAHNYVWNRNLCFSEGTICFLRWVGHWHYTCTAGAGCCRSAIMHSGTGGTNVPLELAFCAKKNS